MILRSVWEVEIRCFSNSGTDRGWRPYFSIIFFELLPTLYHSVVFVVFLFVHVKAFVLRYVYSTQLL